MSHQTRKSVRKCLSFKFSDLDFDPKYWRSNDLEVQIWLFFPLDNVKRSKHKKFQGSKLMQSDVLTLWKNACFFGIFLPVPPPPYVHIPVLQDYLSSPAADVKEYAIGTEIRTRLGKLSFDDHKQWNGINRS